MFYIVYKTINLVNNKFYIGKHRQAIDPHQFDGYYGSGPRFSMPLKNMAKTISSEKLYLYSHANPSACSKKKKQ